MDAVTGLLVGVVQGVAEWLPVSSSGQSMLVFLNLLSISPAQAFTFALYLHFGTVLAVLVRFRNEYADIVSHLPRFREDETTRFLVYATIVSAGVGLPVYLLFKGWVDAWQGEFVTGLIGLMLVFTGMALSFSQTRMGIRDVGKLRFNDAAWAGLAQGVAILPGVSRSGMTVAVLLARRVDAEAAMKLSFLMSVPAITGAVAIEAVSEGFADLGASAILFGIAASFVAGYLMIDVLLTVARRIRFDLFCIGFGLLAVFVVSIPWL